MSKTNNVLYLSHSGSFGGAQKSLLALVNHIKTKKMYKAHFIFGSSGEFFDHISANGFTVYQSPLLRWNKYKLTFKKTIWFIYNFFFGTFKICKIIKEKNISIVHTNTIFNFQGALAAKIMRVNHVWHVREDLSLPYFQFLIPYRIIIKLIKVFSDTIICISEVESRLFADSKKTKVIYNTWQISPEITHNKKYHIQKSNNDKILFGQIGFIFPNKNQRWCIESFIDLCDINDNCELLIIGKIVDDNYYKNLVNLIDKSGLQKKIKFIPSVNNIENWYKKIDVLINPMLRGIVGRVTIEAMSFGIPCIGNSDGIDQSLFKNNLNGYLVNFDDKEAMKNSMLKLVNPILRSKFGDASFKKSNEVLTNSIYGESISNIYKNLLI